MNISQLNPALYNSIAVTVAPQTQGPTMTEDKSFADYGSHAESQTLTAVLDSFSSNRSGAEYSVTDALTNIWVKEHRTFNLNDAASWQAIDAKAAPTQEELNSLQMRLQQSGLSGSIDWTGLNTQIDKTANVSGDNLIASADRLAANFATVQDKIQRNYSGNELQEQLAQLENVFQSGIEKVATSYAERLSTAFGLSDNESADIVSSLQSAIEKRTAEYQDILHSGLVSFNDSDAWLQNHEEYMAEQLIGQSSSIDTQTANNQYSLQDLAIAGKIENAYHSLAQSASRGGLNEIDMAFQFSIIELKTEDTAQSGAISNAMAALLDRAKQTLHSSVIDAANDKFASRRDTLLSGESTGNFPAINKNMISAVYQQIGQTYKSTGNIAKALYQGVSAAKDTVAAAHDTSPKVSRWGISLQTELNEFFTPKEVTGLDKVANDLFNSPSIAQSTYQKYLNAWQNVLSFGSTTVSENYIINTKA